MKQYLAIIVLTILLSCKEKGDMKGSHTPIPYDSICITQWSSSFFELETQDFDFITDSVYNTLKKILGSSSFSEKEFAGMKDTLKKAVFSLEDELRIGNYQIDTTNLLLMKDHIKYYLSDSMHQRKYNWKKMITQNHLTSFQNSKDFEIGYDVQPCIKKLYEQTSKLKRVRKGNSLPAFSKGSNGLLDQVNVYKCLLHLSIYLDVTDKSGFSTPRRRYYKIQFVDFAKVYSDVDLKKQSNTIAKK